MRGGGVEGWVGFGGGGGREEVRGGGEGCVGGLEGGCVQVDLGIIEYPQREQYQHKQQQGVEYTIFIQHNTLYSNNQQKEIREVLI